MKPQSKRQTRKLVDKLAPESGNILVVRMETTGPEGKRNAERMAHDVANYLAASGVEVGVLVIGPNDRINVLDDQAMAAQGWVRTDRDAASWNHCLSTAIEMERYDCAKLAADFPATSGEFDGYNICEGVADAIRARSAPSTSGAGSGQATQEESSCHPPVSV